MSIKLIIGLRNPGPAYAGTRHNVGEWFAKSLARQEGVAFTSEKSFHGELAQFTINNHSCKILLPLTFMNHSGQPARAISQFYRFTPQEILIVQDELDLPPGCIRLKTGGGHGGHNGLKDIISHLGSPDFHRLRIGIGHPGDRTLVHDYVLSKPSLYDKQQIEEAIERGIDLMPLVLSGDVSGAMNLLNR